MRTFFRPDAFRAIEEWFEVDKIKSELAERGGSLLTLEEANALEHHEFFDLLTTHAPPWSGAFALPLFAAEVQHTVLPFPYDDHDEVSFENGRLSHWVEKELNAALPGQKFILSCDPSYFVGFKIGHFRYDDLHNAAAHAGMNSTYILFDEARRTWATFCQERPFVVVSQRGKAINDCPLGKSREFWSAFFRDNSSQAITHYSPEAVLFLNRIYLPRLPGTQLFTR